ncbi:MAG: fatty acid desaturase [Bacteriovoracia bacterium]
MSTTWLQFKKDYLFLTKYLLGQSLILLLLIAVLWQAPLIDYQFAWNAWSLMLPPMWLILGIQLPVIMHNCIHGNFKTKIYNEILGESFGLYVLMSLRILRINHFLHHAHADTKNDPHAPDEDSFFVYFFRAQITGSNVIEKHYLQFHGDTPRNRRIFTLNKILHYLGHPLRAMLWFVLLGPSLFLVLYVPSFMIYSMAFAHVNYITHQRNGENEVVIINKNNNYYYQFINWIGMGVYFHKNHHQNPKLLNPKFASLNKRLV